MCPATGDASTPQLRATIACLVTCPGCCHRASAATNALPSESHGTVHLRLDSFHLSSLSSTLRPGTRSRRSLLSWFCLRSGVFLGFAAFPARPSRTIPIPPASTTLSMPP